MLPLHASPPAVGRPSRVARANASRAAQPWWRRPLSATGCLRALSLGLLTLCAAAQPLALDEHTRLALILTYAPRLPLAAGGLLLALLCWRRRGAAGWSLACTALLVQQLGWGGGARAAPADALTALVANVHHDTEGLDGLVALCAARDVDVLMLQEVAPPQRPAYVAALGETYRFFAPDETTRFEFDNEGPFSNLIGVRASRLDETPVRVDTALTGYRTFAARVSLDGRPLWLVDVHTTKAFWTHAGLDETLVMAAYKARRHTDERARLARWLADNTDAPVLVGGDFNAPLGSRNLRLPGLTHAHGAAGSGPHLTIPAAWPIWGLDHVLAGADIEFFEYELLDTGRSDHRAQLVRFGFAPAR